MNFLMTLLAMTSLFAMAFRYVMVISPKPYMQYWNRHSTKTFFIYVSWALISLVCLIYGMAGGVQ